MKPLTKKQILKRLAKGKNFAETYLQYAQLREADLFKGNFFRANLEGADLEGANLVRTNFLEANLEGTNLLDANLSEGYFEDANLYRADMEDCDVRKADLKGANLRDVNACGACFEQADMERVQAAGANFSGALFIRTDLSGANLAATNCRGTSFFKAVLNEALLNKADLRDCDLRCASLQNVDLEDADLRGANLEGADITGALMDGCKLENCRLPEGRFDRLSARWLDLGYDGKGGDRVDLEEQGLMEFQDPGASIFLEISELPRTASVIGFFRFLSVMETLLPKLSLAVRHYDAYLNRVQFQLSLSGSPGPSIYSFCFFLVYQFDNADHINCSYLEDRIIELKSPILSPMLSKKRPLTGEIIKQVLKVKKVLKADSLFFRGSLFKLELTDPHGEKVVMKPLKQAARGSYLYHLEREKKDIF